MKNTILQIYCKAKYQHCCVNGSRKIAHKVRVKDRKEICDNFKANSIEEASTILFNMNEKWQKAYPKMTQSLIENQGLLIFYKFPPSIHRTIYSTNLIESFNKQIKKYSRRKE